MHLNDHRMSPQNTWLIFQKVLQTIAFYFSTDELQKLQVTNNSIDDINRLDERTSVLVCTRRYVVYSNMPFYKCCVFLMQTFVYTRAHNVKSWIKQNRMNNIAQVKHNWNRTIDIISIDTVLAFEKTLDTYDTCECSARILGTWPHC
jgi:hypothetical protein